MTSVTLLCDHCGNAFDVPSYRMGTARFCSKRCSNLAYAPDREQTRLRATLKHGHARKDWDNPNSNRRSHTPEYRAWMAMKTRVKHHLSYVRHGITVCDRWLYGEEDKHPYLCFLEDMGQKPSSNHTLDRFPNAVGNYEPTNCRWATSAEQGWSKFGTKQDPETVKKRSAAMMGNQNALGNVPNVTDGMREKCRQAALKQHADGRAKDPGYKPGHARNGMHKKCENCGSRFYVEPAQVEDETVRFCSKPCKDSGYAWVTNGHREIKLWNHTPKPKGKWRPGRLPSSTPGRPRKEKSVPVADISTLPKTRGEARELGLKWFFTGKTCDRGHLAARYVSSATCMECHKSRMFDMYQQNR